MTEEMKQKMAKIAILANIGLSEFNLSELGIIRWGLDRHLEEVLSEVNACRQSLNEIEAAMVEEIRLNERSKTE